MPRPLVLLLALAVTGPPVAARATARAAVQAHGPGPVPASAAVHDGGPRTDTVLRVRRGDALHVSDLSGYVRVVGRDVDEVRIETDASDRPRVAAARRDGRVTLGARDPKGRSLDLTVTVEVPRWMALDLRGRRLRVAVEGVRAPVEVRNLEGDLLVRDVEGDVRVHSVNGRVRVEDVRGEVTVRTVSEGVDLLRVRGTVLVESTDGDVVLEDVTGPRVSATTVDGDVEFAGDLPRNTRVALSTHDGDVDVRVPRGAGLDVTVSTFDGSFESSFPVVLRRFRGGKEMEFTLGAGGARLEVQAFDGDIRLRYR